MLDRWGVVHQNLIESAILDEHMIGSFEELILYANIVLATRSLKLFAGLTFPQARFVNAIKFMQIHAACHINQHKRLNISWLVCV